MLLGVTGKKSKRKIWMQLRNKIELYKIRRVLKPIGCVSAQRREERLIISFNGNWLGYIEKGKLHIKDSEVSKIYLPEAAVVLDDSGRCLPFFFGMKTRRSGFGLYPLVFKEPMAL